MVFPSAEPAASPPASISGKGGERNDERTTSSVKQEASGTVATTQGWRSVGAGEQTGRGCGACHRSPGQDLGRRWVLLGTIKLRSVGRAERKGTGATRIAAAVCWSDGFGQPCRSSGALLRAAQQRPSRVFRGNGDDWLLQLRVPSAAADEADVAEGLAAVGLQRLDLRHVVGRD